MSLGPEGELQVTLVQLPVQEFQIVVVSANFLGEKSAYRIHVISTYTSFKTKKIKNNNFFK
jgi:hypothetical protein